MHSWIQFVSTPNADASGTLLHLFFDDKRYLIGNIHEGLSRACIQTGTKLMKLSDIFITGKTEWKNTGGLIGIILSYTDTINAALASAAEQKRQKVNRQSTQDYPHDRNSGNAERCQQDGHFVNQGGNLSGGADEKPTLGVHGGPNVLHTIASMRRFIFRSGVPVKVREYSRPRQFKSLEEDWEPDWFDDKIKVWAIPVAPSAGDDNMSSLRPDSPLKRTFDEFSGEGSEIYIKDRTSDINLDSEDQALREMIVSRMFDSDWSLDHLEQIPLAQVDFAAKLFLRDEKTSQYRAFRVPKEGEGSLSQGMKVFQRLPWPGAQVELPSTMPSPIAMSYIIRRHRLRGKFLAEKAEALKIPGPLRSLLSSGKAVSTPDGRVITPEMVLGETREGGGIAVVDLPSEEYVHNLVQRPEWKNSKLMSGVGAIVWILGAGVGQSKELRDFINDRKELKHIVSSPDCCSNNISYDSAASSAIRLHQINPDHYPIPVHDNVTLAQTDQPRIESAITSNCIQAHRGLKILLESKMKIEENVTPNVDVKQIVQSIPPEVIQLAQAARSNVSSDVMQKEKISQGLPSPDAEIICLGTGSALPSKYRNVSGTLLRVPGCGSYLFDCGENSLGQLRRIFDHEELRKVLRDIKLIWNSHVHADHLLGTISIVKAWCAEKHTEKPLVLNARSSTPSQNDETISSLQNGDKLCIVGSEYMISWLKDYSSAENFGYHHLFPITCYAGGPDKQWLSKLAWQDMEINLTGSTDIDVAVQKATGIQNLQACSVFHCSNARAVSVEFPSGFKFSYSGDCRPSKRFAEIGKDSTVLVHEATFDDELQGEAVNKKHSTTSEAIGVGLAMKAKRIILTHFSQRYQKIPVMSPLETSHVKFDDVGDPNDAVDAVEGIYGIDGLNDNTSFESPLQPKNALEPASSTHSLNDSVVDTSSTGVSANELPKPINNVFKDVKVGVAFDYMRVKVADIIHLEEYTPALMRLFEEESKEELQSQGTKPHTSQTQRKQEKQNNSPGRNSQQEKKRQKQAEWHERMKTSKASVPQRQSSPEKTDAIGQTIGEPEHN